MPDISAWMQQRPRTEIVLERSSHGARFPALASVRGSVPVVLRPQSFMAQEAIECSRSENALVAVTQEPQKCLLSPGLGLDTALTALGIRLARDTSDNRFYPMSGAY